MSYDIELMMETSERMAENIAKQFETLAESHGDDFAISVMGNVGCHLLTKMLASEDDDQEQFIKLLTVVQVLTLNMKSETASYKAEEIIERIKKGSK